MHRQRVLFSALTFYFLISTFYFPLPYSSGSQYTATPARSRSAFHQSRAPARPRSSPGAGHYRRRYLSRRHHGISASRPSPSFRLDRRRSFLRPERLLDRRPACGAARARSEHQARTFLRPTCLAHFACLPRRPCHLPLSAVLARVSGNVSAVEISSVRPKHWVARRHCLFARLVARRRGPVLSHSAICSISGELPALRCHHLSVRHRDPWPRASLVPRDAEPR